MDLTATPTIRPTRTLLPLLIAVAALGAAGCNRQADSPPAPTTAPAASAPAPSAPAAAAPTSSAPAAAAPAAAAPAAAASAAATPAAAAPAVARTLRVGSTSYPTSLDPASSGGGSDHPYLYLAYDRLIDADRQTGELKPGLATAWKFSPDGLQLELTLREGVKFHDGSVLDADAVVASIRRYQDRKVQTDLKIVSRAEAKAPNVVLLTLASPDSSVPAILADRGGMIVSKAAVEKFGDKFPQNPVGTGPYRIASTVTGASVTYQRFDDYWAGQPKLAGVSWTTYTEVVALENAAVTGQLDVALQIPARDVAALRGKGNFEVSEGPSLEVTLMMLNGSLPPTNSKPLRQALSYAINRDDILKATNGGAGAVATQLLPPSSPYYSKEIEARFGYKPELAQKAMQDPGLKNVALECTYFPGLGYEIAGPLMVENAAKVGIKLTLVERTLAQGVADMAAGKSPCFLTRWTGRPDPAMTLFGVFDSRGFANYGKNQIGVDTLMNEMLATSDPARRVELGQKIALLGAEDPLSIPLVYQPAVALIGRNVEGYVPNYLGKQDLRSVSLR
ncbi:MAG: ABC transporter substrate-binding protein [Lautropia sp.]